VLMRRHDTRSTRRWTDVPRETMCRQAVIEPRVPRPFILLSHDFTLRPCVGTP
jgi:hypothetical protein